MYEFRDCSLILQWSALVFVLKTSILICLQLSVNVAQKETPVIHCSAILIVPIKQSKSISCWKYQLSGKENISAGFYISWVGSPWRQTFFESSGSIGLWFGFCFVLNRKIRREHSWTGDKWGCGLNMSCGLK